MAGFLLLLSAVPATPYACAQSSTTALAIPTTVSAAGPSSDIHAASAPNGSTAAEDAEHIDAEIAQSGGSASLYSQLGLARYRNHQPDKSLNAFTAMLRYRQPNADELRIIALDYVELRDLHSADKWLNASIKLNPADWRTWRYLGGVQFSEEQVTEAIESFRRCLQLDPHNSLAEDGLARSLEAAHNNVEAQKHFQLAEQFNLASQEPSSLPSLHYGEFLYRQQHLPESSAELRRAARLDPSDSETHEYLSYVFQECGNRKKALAEMREASRLRPDSPRLHLLLGRLYRSAGSLTEANTEINKYVELSHQHKEDWDR